MGSNRKILDLGQHGSVYSKKTRRITCQFIQKHMREPKVFHFLLCYICGYIMLKLGQLKQWKQTMTYETGTMKSLSS